MPELIMWPKCCCNSCKIYENTFDSAFDPDPFTITGATPTTSGGKLQLGGQSLIGLQVARKSTWNFTTGTNTRPVSWHIVGLQNPGVNAIIRFYTRYDAGLGDYDYLEVAYGSHIKFVSMNGGTTLYENTAYHFADAMTYNKKFLSNSITGGVVTTKVEDYTTEIESYLDGRPLDIEIRHTRPGAQDAPGGGTTKSANVAIKISCKQYADGTGVDCEWYLEARTYPSDETKGGGVWGIEMVSGTYEIDALYVYGVDDTDAGSIPFYGECAFAFHRQNDGLSNGGGSGTPINFAQSGWNVANSVPSFINKNQYDAMHKGQYTVEVTGIPTPSGPIYDGSTPIIDGMDSLNGTWALDRLCGHVRYDDGYAIEHIGLAWLYQLAGTSIGDVTILLTFANGSIYTRLSLLVDSMTAEDYPSGTVATYSVLFDDVFQLKPTIFDPWNDNTGTAYPVDIVPLFDNDEWSASMGPWTLTYSIDDRIAAGGTPPYDYYRAVEWSTANMIVTI